MAVNAQYTPVYPAQTAYSDVETPSYVGWDFNEEEVTFNQVGYLFNYKEGEGGSIAC